jgi:hypothetical protein
MCVYRLPEDGGVQPKHVAVNKRLYCCVCEAARVCFINENSALCPAVQLLYMFRCFSQPNSDYYPEQH